MFLFRVECKKIIKSILFWVYVLVLFGVCIIQYDPVVKNELQRTDDPNSVFYISPSGSYADVQSNVSNEAMERDMMIGATNRLLNNYRSNSYEYYPFGYVKEKTMSLEEQAVILQYLVELTGLSEKEINTDISSTDGTNIDDIEISGGGAYIATPDKGSMNESGQFVIEPDEWEYVPNDGASAEKSSQTSDTFEIQVSFDRFKEIMEEVNKLIGRNSYYSWTMLTLYYFENDLEDAPITEQQHQDFYEDDQVTGAFARYYCDSISLVVLFLPAFIVIELMLRDKRCKMRGLIYPRTISSASVIFTRYIASVCMTMLPIFILPIKSLILLIHYCNNIGVQADIFAFAKYTLLWILPTVLFVVAISLFVTVLLENYTAILVTGLMWLTCRPSIDKIAGGNYGLFDLVIRHNTLKGYGRMMENIQMLVLNRMTISAVSLMLVILSIMIYSKKRKGGLIFGGQKFLHNYKIKRSSDF